MVYHGLEPILFAVSCREHLVTSRRGEESQGFFLFTGIARCLLRRQGRGPTWVLLRGHVVIVVKAKAEIIARITGVLHPHINMGKNARVRLFLVQG